MIEVGGLHRLLVETAERCPTRPVLVGPHASTTYAELNKASGRIAWSLASLGLRRGDRVVLAVSGGWEHLAAYYGVLKAGAVVVPHNPDTRSAILGHCISHCDAKMLFLDADNLALLSDIAPAPPTLEQVVAVGKAGPTELPGLQVTELDAVLGSTDELHDTGAYGDDLASLVYTSGTTGQPKGVMLSHRNVLANVRSILGYLQLGPDEIMAMTLPFHYAYGTSVMHTHVAAGGALAMVGSVAFPSALLEAVQDLRCTGLAGVPSTFAHLVRANVSRFDLSSLRYLTQAGGPMSAELTRRVRAAFPAARLFVMYGQTEATARLSYVPPAELERKLGSVGIPIPGVDIAIVDEAGRPVAPGQQGEVVARGANVMLGYWKDPVATAQVLRDDGLHTGDLGWMDADGYLHLVARLSDIIKSGGHRIGPREIEEVIERLPGVVECGVVGVPDEMLGESIVALVVAGEQSLLDAETIRRGALAFLPRYKVPHTVRFLPSLPRTASGKVSRTALLSLALTSDNSTAAAKDEGIPDLSAGTPTRS